MRRREVIAGLAGDAVWRVAPGQQQVDRLRRIGVGIPARSAAFADGVLRLSALVLIYTELGFSAGEGD